MLVVLVVALVCLGVVTIFESQRDLVVLDLSICQSLLERCNATAARLIEKVTQQLAKMPSGTPVRLRYYADLPLHCKLR